MEKIAENLYRLGGAHHPCFLAAGADHTVLDDARERDADRTTPAHRVGEIADRGGEGGDVIIGGKSENTDESSIADGIEVCAPLWDVCLVQCLSSADCPCGLACRWMMVMNVCTP